MLALWRPQNDFFWLKPTPVIPIYLIHTSYTYIHIIYKHNTQWLKPMKTHTTLTIDFEVMEKAKGLSLNISQECENFLRNRVNNFRKDLNFYDLKLLLLKKDKVSKVLGEKQAELRNIEEQIHSINEKAKEEEEKRLQLEKEALEKEKLCVVCLKPVLGKFRTWHGKMVCNNCFVPGLLKKIPLETNHE